MMLDSSQLGQEQIFGLNFPKMNEWKAFEKMNILKS